MTERERIQDLAETLNARGPGRDQAGYPCIWGRCDKALHLENNIHADGQGFCLAVSMPTQRKLTAALEHLAFCDVRQRGDREAVLYLNRMPTEQESWDIRRYLGIRRRRVVSDETLQRLKKQGFKARSSGVGVKTA